MSCPNLVQRAMAVRPDGFVMKLEPMDEVVHLVEEVAEGRTMFSREVMELDRRGAGSKIGGGILLSAAEDSVLRLMVDGKSTKEMAALRHASDSTVEKQRASIFSKLGVRCAAEAVSKARRIGLVS